jgi:hypothetical protein
VGFCAAIKPDGVRCKARAMQGSQWCFNHHPDHSEERRRNASKGGKRGGRGRPQAELAEIKNVLHALATGVIKGSTDRQDAAVAGQLLNTVIRAIGMEMKVREVEELAREVEELRDIIEANNGANRWGA